MTWELLSAEPAAKYLSRQDSVKLARVTANNTTFVSWEVLFSSDAGLEVTQDCKFKLRNALSAMQSATQTVLPTVENYTFPASLSGDETASMKQAWIDANVALANALSGGTGTITADSYTGKADSMPMAAMLQLFGDGEKITAATMLRAWDTYMGEEWGGRLIPGQFRRLAGTLLPDGVKLGVTFPASDAGDVTDKYEGKMEL